MTSKPFCIRSAAQLSPDGPLPITATFLPILSEVLRAFPCFIAKSPTYLSSPPTDTLPPAFSRRTQCSSHCFSCGQTLPQTDGRLLSLFRLFTAFSMSPHLIKPINFGIFTPTGQPLLQGAFLQFKHLSASFFATSSENPSDTSSKLCRLTSGG